MLIIIYGYSAIGEFIGRTKDIALINFKTDLQSEVRVMAKDFGSVKKVELQMPGDTEMLCLVDLNYANKATTCLCERCTNKEKEFQPAVCDSWTTPGNEDNAFLFPLTPMKVVNMEIDNGYICISPNGPRVSLRLEGKGDKTHVSEWVN